MSPITFALLYFAIISVVTFIAYAKDKYAAMNNRWRIDEQSLHLLALLGGWPAAFVAQRVLQHKSKKRKFRRLYFLTIVLNSAAVAGLFMAMQP